MRTEQLDRIGFGDIEIAQGDGFRYGVDAVLLASFAAGETGAAGVSDAEMLSCADLGCGNGIVSLIFHHKKPNTHVIGVEVQEEEAGRAAWNILYNGLDDAIRIHHADIGELPDDIVRLGVFDVVMTNPPYFRLGAAIPNQTDGKYIARHETTADLRAILRVSSELLCHRGDFYMIHRPSRLAEIFGGMREYGIEPKEMQMVIPRPGEVPNLVLVHGIKGAGPELRILPEICVRGEDGFYSEMVNKIYERSVHA